MVPSLFISHGSPMIALEDNEYTRFLSAIGERIEPRAIVIFSAHWESNVLSVSFNDDEYETIYDFGGFPAELYTLNYPAKGSTQIASRVLNLFDGHGIGARKERKRGLDHGSWVILRHMYPKANIPVVQVSVNPYLPAKDQFEIGKSLRSLGHEDILVIGSGATVHNLRMLMWEQSTPEPWAVEFDDWLIDKVQKKDLDALFSYETLAPYVRWAVPRAEHFIPLFIAMGSADPTAQPKVIHRHYEMGTLSYLCFEF